MFQRWIATGTPEGDARDRPASLRGGGLDSLRELAAAIEPSGFMHLPVSAAHAAGVALLEPHHNDPFDRLLIAQAMHDGLPLVSRDPNLGSYSVERIW